MVKLTHSRAYYGLVTVYVCFTLTIALVSSEKLLEPVRFFTIRSDSMHPAINTGSFIMVKRQDTYQPGDIISYYAKINHREEIITHRIWKIGGNVYVTKGDANQAIDREIVVPRLVIGKVTLIIPVFGHVVNFIKSGIGSILFIILPAMVIIGNEIYKIILLMK